MVNQKHTKRKRDIKSKLMAAICMLLVSSIMMVSSTYAWFTLSTAPEVTGITTAVGANGNLEMALLPADGSIDTINQNSGVGNSTADITLRNTTWGNLVDVSSETYYGLQNITLYPSALETGNGGTDALGNPTKLLGAAYLATPTYGADGRVAELIANTSTGVYNTAKSQFFPDADGATNYGVRAVGTASGMTARQLAYRNAKAAGNAAKGLATTYAAQSLTANGNALATIAVKKALVEGATYTADDLAAMGRIITELTKDEGVLDQIETAYIQYLVAFAASAEVTEDSVYTTIQAEAQKEGASLTTVKAKIDELLKDKDVTLPAALTAGMDAFNASVTTVGQAKSAYEELAATPEPYSWEQISPILSKLANPDNMKVNNYTMAQIQADKNPLVNEVIGGKGITVTVPSGGGVYADVADQCGDYKANVKVEGVEAMGITINTDAIMDTESNVSPAYLVQMEKGVNEAKAPASGAAGSNPMSDMFGYIIDMAFRTNAAESELRLQQDAIDRIYSTNKVGAEIETEKKDAEGNPITESTMGHGATMTFQSADPTFGTEKVKGLMSAIRLVFFDPDTKDVYATGKLDITNATIGTDGVTAKIYLYEKVAGGTVTYSEITKAKYDEAVAAGVTGVDYYSYTAATYEGATPVAGDGKTYYTLVDGKYVVAEDTTAEGTYYIQKTAESYDKLADDTAIQAVYTAGNKVYVQNTATGNEVAVANNKIMNLNQNTAHKLSVLVYLDGNLVGNDDVAVAAAQSMTGKMNLQFTSSATLVPMEYAQLMTSGNNNGDEGNSN